jgi:2-oxoglutarate ferredoxin oxidoreductase subunit delta
MAWIKLNKKWCKGCGFCIEICPKQIYIRDSEVSARGIQEIIIRHPEKCIACRLCEYLCPDLAITIIAEDTQNLNSSPLLNENHR